MARPTPPLHPPAFPVNPCASESVRKPPLLPFSHSADPGRPYRSPQSSIVSHAIACSPTLMMLDLYRNKTRFLYNPGFCSDFTYPLNQLEVYRAPASSASFHKTDSFPPHTTFLLPTRLRSPSSKTYLTAHTPMPPKAFKHKILPVHMFHLDSTIIFQPC